MNKLEKEIQARIQDFVNELTTLVKRAALESVAEAFDEKAPAPAQRAAASPPQRSRGGRVVARRPARGRHSRKKGEKRSPEELEQLTEQLYAEIKSEPGRRIEPIAEAMGVTTKELRLPMAKLIENRKVRTRDQKRSMKYFPK